MAGGIAGVAGGSAQAGGVSGTAGGSSSAGGVSGAAGGFANAGGVSGAGGSSGGAAGTHSLRSIDNGPNQYEYGRLTQFPPGFGAQEFTFEIWVRLDSRSAYPVGPCGSGGDVRRNWCSENNPRYVSNCWWCNGNFLIDGVEFNNPQGIGTFALQFYGGGRVRWLFGDGAPTASNQDGYWSVGNGPSASNPSLLDGRWHGLAVVRRFLGVSGAALELWIDGHLIDTETTFRRTNLESSWSSYASSTNAFDGWYFFAEKQAALGRLSLFEDYKGPVDEMRFYTRAKSPTELGQWRTPVSASTPGLVAWFDFTGATSNRACDRLGGNRCLTLVDGNPTSSILSDENVEGLDGGP
jgi:hypothetical protein